MADARLIPSGINDATSQAVNGLLDRFDALDQDGLLSTPVDTRLDAVLEHLAWAYHVDGWEYVTTRAQKIDLIKQMYEFHRYKGTKAGLALYFRTFLERDLLAAAPLTKSYCGSSLTDAERTAWSANMPEIRVYPYRHGGTRQGMFVGDCLGASYPNTSDAILRIGDKVTLYDPVDGTERDLDTLATERDTITKMAVQRVPVRLPGQASRALFAGRCLGRVYTCNTGAASRMYVLDLDVGYTDEVSRRIPLSVRPSLDPVRVGSEVVASPGRLGHGIFLGHRWPDGWPERAVCFLTGRFPAKSTAGDRLYRRTKLFDASRAQFDRRTSSLFCGCFRLGALRPHHAEAAVDMLRPAPRRALFGGGFPGSFPCNLQAGAWIDKMCRVGRMAVRLSDKIAVSITNRRPIRASAGVLCGSFVAGAYQLEAY